MDEIIVPPIIEISFEGQKVDGPVRLDMNFTKEKDFSFQMRNTHTYDYVFSPRLLTNLPLAYYEVVSSPTEIPPLESRDFVIRIKAQPILAESIKETAEIRKPAILDFKYTRRKTVFV